MSYGDMRGAQWDLDITASAGVNTDVVAKDNAGSVIDITGYAIQCTVRDDREQARDYGGQYGTETSYTMTITDAANGEFDFIIPSTEFTNKEGGRLTYELYWVDPNGNRVGLMWGYINVLERG